MKILLDECVPWPMRRLLSPSARLERTGDSSPEVSSTTFSAQPPHLRSVPLMDMDFAI